MQKAKKKASALIENEDLGSREKSKEIKKMYQKAHASVKPKETQYVVAKKFNAAGKILNLFNRGFGYHIPMKN